MYLTKYRKDWALSLILILHKNSLNSTGIILSEVQTFNTEVHIYFSLERKTHTCPHCQALTDTVHDYRTSIIKDVLFMGKKLTFTTEKGTIIALTVTNIFMNRFPYFQNIVVLLLEWLFITFIF